MLKYARIPDAAPTSNAHLSNGSLRTLCSA
jgi:hypothetical protein